MVLLSIGIGFLFYISRKKQLSLENNNYELSEEVEQLKIELKNKEKFISQVGEDFKDPIISIFNQSREISKESLSKIQENKLNQIEISSQYMLGKINDIVDLSKISKKTLILKKQHFNLNNIIESSLQMVTKKAKNNNIEVSIDLEDKLAVNFIGDSERFSQILINILDNAISFTKNGYVSLSVKKTSNIRDNITLEFNVTDTGIGILKEDLPHVFDAYYQGKTKKDCNGLGLGLYISKQLIEMMEGKIEIKNSTNQGTTTTFELTFILQDRLDRRTYRLTDSTLLDKKVLISESSDKKLSSLMKTVGYFKHKIDVIPSLEEFEITPHLDYDILIINEMQLNENVLKIITQLKIQNIKIVVITNNLEPKENDLINYYLQTPITQYRVLAMINSFDFSELPQVDVVADANPFMGEIKENTSETLAQIEDTIKEADKKEDDFTLKEVTPDEVVLSQENVEDKTIQIELEEVDLIIETGLNNCANDKNLYHSMLEEFVASYVESVEIIEELYKRQEFKKARLFAMEIKDTALHLGAFNLAESIASLEYELEKETNEEIQKLLELFSQKLEKLLIEIEKELEN